MKDNILKISKLQYFLGLLIFCLPAMVFSQPVTETKIAQITPYILETQVNTDAEEERKQVFSKVLEQLLIKISNDTKIVSTPAVKAALADPNIYIERYTYTHHLVTSGALGPQVLFLQIQFNQTAVTNLLRQMTPQVLVCLAKVTPSGNRILEGESSNDIIVPILKRSAENFGVAIILPIYDLQDAEYIKTANICNLDIAAIKKAAYRYKTATVVAGCVTEPTKKDLWTSQWLVLRNDKTSTFNFSGDTQEAVINQIMEVISSGDIKSEKKVFSPDKKIILRISNINGLGQHNEVTQYLASFSKIAKINLVKIGPKELEFSINIKNDPKILLEAFSTQNKLLAIEGTPPAGVDLDYKWVSTSNEQSQTVDSRPVS
jgi:uncharacterized protein